VSPDIDQNHLSYARRLDKRDVKDIQLVVVHCTELPDLAMARKWGEKLVHQDTQTGNSGHFYIDRDGMVEQWVPLNRVAHHVRGVNTNSIGIELVNTGRYPNWFRSGHQVMTEPYPDKQLQALISLLNHLERELPGLQSIAGHEDLDIENLPSEDRAEILISRKVDPGPLFPWPAILKSIALKRVTIEDL
jgi:N-acetylmuramoyl-L-alanine amidase